MVKIYDYKVSTPRRPGKHARIGTNEPYILYSGTRTNICYKLSSCRYGRVYQCGVVSTNKLKWKVGKRPVLCMLEDERDYYGRYIGYCSLSSTNVSKSLNAWMVYWGYAVSYRYYSKEFIPQEDRAKRLRRGLWSGSFEMPWDWRRNN